MVDLGIILFPSNWALWFLKKSKNNNKNSCILFTYKMPKFTFLGNVLYFSTLKVQCFQIKKPNSYKYQRIPSLTQSLLANVPFYEIGPFVMRESRIN